MKVPINLSRRRARDTEGVTVAPRATKPDSSKNRRSNNSKFGDRFDDKISRPRPGADLDLTSIYKKDKKDQLAKLEGRPKSESFRRIIFSLLGLAAISLFGFLFMRPATPPTAATLSVIAPESADLLAGKFLALPFTVKNNLSVSVKSATVEIIPPIGWRLKSTDPVSSSERNLIWNFTNLNPGETKIITLSGWLLQAPGWSGTWQINGQYEPTNFSSPFPIQSVWNTTATTSAYALAFSLEPNLNLNWSTTETELPPGLELRLTWPITVPRPTYTPAPLDPINPIWPLNTSNNTATNNFTVNIQMSDKPATTIPPTIKIITAADGTQTQEIVPAPVNKVQAELWWKDTGPQASEARKLLDASQDLISDAAAASLRLISKINNESNLKAVDWGKPFTWTFAVANETDATLTNNQIRFFIKSEALQEIKIQPDPKKPAITLPYDANLGYVTVTSKEWPSLATISPQATVPVNFILGVKSFTQIQNPNLTTNYQFNGYAELQAVSNKVASTPSTPIPTTPIPNSDLPSTPLKPVVSSTNSGPAFNVNLKSSPQKISLNSFWLVKSSLNYYSDAGLPLGEGAWPLTAGQDTTLILRHQLTNVTHQLQSVKYSVVLPAEVTYVAPTDDSLGVWSYDAETNKLTWTLNQIPAATSIGGRSVSIGASLKIKPKAASATAITLVPASNFEARDSVTNTVTKVSVPKLTSALENDVYGKNSGSINPASVSTDLNLSGESSTAVKTDSAVTIN